MLNASTLLFLDFKAKHRSHIVFLPSWESHHPSKRTKNLEVWAEIVKTSELSYTLCIFRRFIVSYTVASSFNNERGFYSVVLLHHEHRCPVRDFRGWMKDSLKQMGSMCTRSAQPARPPFGQQNCPVMDSCAQGRAYSIGSEITRSIYGPPQGLETHWPEHPTADRQRESFSQGQPPSVTLL